MANPAMVKLFFGNRRGFKDMTPEKAYDHVMSERRIVPGMQGIFGSEWGGRATVLCEICGNLGIKHG